jgi:hypothetical protein
MFQRTSLFLFGLLSLAGCASNTVVVRVDDNSPETREVQKMDCRVYDTRGEAMRTGIDFGVLFGLVRGGPYVEQAKISGVKWDRSVNQMIAQYKEVCSRFNSGVVSQAAYNVRVAEIDQLWAEAQGIRQSADEAIRSHGRESFGELERSTQDNPGAGNDQRQSIVVAIDALVIKLGGQ